MLNTKEHILKSIENQTTLEPIDYHCMDKKHWFIYLLLCSAVQKKESVSNLWQNLHLWVKYSCKSWTLKEPPWSNNVFIWGEKKWESTRMQKRECFSLLMLSEGGNEKGELWVNKWTPPMSLLEFLLHPPLHWCFIRPIIFSKIAALLQFSLIFLSKRFHCPLGLGILAGTPGCAARQNDGDEEWDKDREREQWAKICRWEYLKTKTEEVKRDLVGEPTRN